MRSIEVGTGVLGWPSPERIGDRYGLVGLSSEPEGDFAPLRPGLPFGQRGRLVAEVMKTRVSHHIGDLFRGFYPSMPKAGARIVLGEGELFQADGSWHCVGLRPDDGRSKDWLDPKALYRVHNQTVRLMFEPLAQGNGSRS